MWPNGAKYRALTNSMFAKMLLEISVLCRVSVVPVCLLAKGKYTAEARQNTEKTAISLSKHGIR